MLLNAQLSGTTMIKEGGIPLPVELFGLITEHLDDPNILLALRLASKAFDAYFTPLAFRLLHVKGSVNSADTLKEMLNSSRL